MKNNKIAWLWLILVFTVLAATITGCGRSSGSGFAGGNVSETTAAIMAPQYAAETQAYEDYDTYEVMDEALPGAGSETMSTVNTPPAPAASNRKLIRTVTMNVESTDFNTMLKAITDSVAASGGYMQSSEVYGNAATRTPDASGYAHMTIRVPTDQLDSFITKLEAQGNVTYKSEGTEDVTLQYSDIESRKKALTIEQDRLWDLLAKAESIEVIISLEARLSEIRYQLESFEAQLRLYDNQVEYSTINLTLHEVKVLSPTTPDDFTARIQKGFSRNAANLGNNMVNFVVWLLSSLPFLVVYLVIIIIIVMVVRKVRKRISKQDPSEPRKINAKKPSNYTDNADNTDTNDNKNN